MTALFEGLVNARRVPCVLHVRWHVLLTLDGTAGGLISASTCNAVVGQGKSFTVVLHGSHRTVSTGPSTPQVRHRLE